MTTTEPEYCSRCDSTGLVPLVEEREGLKYEVSYRCSCPWGERRWSKRLLFDDQPGTFQFLSRNDMWDRNLERFHTPQEIRAFRTAGLRLAKGAIPAAVEADLRKRWKLPA